MPSLLHRAVLVLFPPRQFNNDWSGSILTPDIRAGNSTSQLDSVLLLTTLWMSARLTFCNEMEIIQPKFTEAMNSNVKKKRKRREERKKKKNIHVSGRDSAKMHLVSAKISTVASQLETHAQELQQCDSSSVLKSNFLYTVVFENTLLMVNFGSFVTYSPIWCALTWKYSKLRGDSGNFG